MPRRVKGYPTAYQPRTPSRKAVRAALEAFAPPGVELAVTAKRKARKLTDDSLEGLNTLAIESEKIDD